MSEVSIDREKGISAGCQIASDMNRVKRRFRADNTHGAAMSFGALYRELEKGLLPLFGDEFEKELRAAIEAGESEARKP